MFNINKPVCQEAWLGDSSYKSSGGTNTASWEDKITQNDEYLLEYYQRQFDKSRRSGSPYAVYWQNKMKELRLEIEQRKEEMNE